MTDVYMFVCHTNDRDSYSIILYKSNKISTSISMSSWEGL